jgi:hypothetical protein
LAAPSDSFDEVAISALDHEIGDSGAGDRKSKRGV